MLENSLIFLCREEEQFFIVCSMFNALKTYLIMQCVFSEMSANFQQRFIDVTNLNKYSHGNLLIFSDI